LEEDIQGIEVGVINIIFLEVGKEILLIQTQIPQSFISKTNLTFSFSEQKEQSSFCKRILLNYTKGRHNQNHPLLWNSSKPECHD